MFLKGSDAQLFHLVMGIAEYLRYEEEVGHAVSFEHLGDILRAGHLWHVLSFQKATIFR